MYIKEKEICPAYISYHNWTREKQIILFKIPNEEKKGLHYFAVKKLSVIKRNNIKTLWSFYCFNYLHSFRTENKLKSHEKVCKNKDFCEILEFKQYMKSNKMPYII